mmetsp:Transcript_61940/g.114969  ORF Transcript_61940/g.114969 Transcript_61940/m.114969 type:complete len:129 (+) Transcript_61940:141-527(+)
MHSLESIHSSKPENCMQDTLAEYMRLRADLGNIRLSPGMVVTSSLLQTIAGSACEARMHLTIPSPRYGRRHEGCGRGCPTGCSKFMLYLQKEGSVACNARLPGWNAKAACRSHWRRDHASGQCNVVGR